MNKKFFSIIAYSTSVLLLTGCGSQIPEMSEQQTEMITEYAAGSVLDQMPQSSSRLVDTSQEFDPAKMTKYEKKSLGIKEPESVAPPAGEQGEEADAGAEAPKPDTLDETVSGNHTASLEDEESAEPLLSVSDVMELPGVDVTYNGFTTAASYPEAAEGSDLFFAMDASAGNQLLIAHLTVTNNTGEETTVDTISRSDLHYRLVLDGSNKQNTLVTLLTDDFSAMNETLGPGESFQAVLIAQVSSELASSVGSVAVEVQSDVGVAQITEN